MDAEKIASPMNLPQSQRKQLDFILLQKPIYKRWADAKKAHGNTHKDSDFAEFLLDTLEQRANSVANQVAEQKASKKEPTYARGTQAVPVPKDLYKELDAISLTLQFKSIVQTIRHLVDLFHEKYPTIKLMNGVSPAKRPRLAMPQASEPSSIEYSLSQGVIPGELLQPVAEDDSMSFLIKNVLQTIESENKNPGGGGSQGSGQGAASSISALAGAMSQAAAVAGGMAPPPPPPPAGPRRSQMPPGARSPLDPDYVQKGHIYECTYCQRLLTTLDEVQNHVFHTHGVEPFFCRLCQSCTSIEEDMVQHVQQNHENIFLCGFENCNYSAARETSIHGHYVASHCKGQVLSTIQVRKGNMWDMYVNRRETGFGLRKTRVVEKK